MTSTPFQHLEQLLAHSRKSEKLCGMSKGIRWRCRDAEEESSIRHSYCSYFLRVQNTAPRQLMQLVPGQRRKPGRGGQGVTLWLCQLSPLFWFCFLHLEKQMCLPDRAEAWKTPDLEVTTSWSRKLPGWFTGQPQLQHPSLAETQPHQCSCKMGLWSGANNNKWPIIDSHIVYT